MDFSSIKYSKNEAVVTITLNRPETLNAFDQEMIAELEEAFLQVQRDRNVRVVILTGAGRGFCAGADLGMVKKLTKANDQRQLLIALNRLILSMRNLDKPVIAAVNGTAVGAGCCLAIACDLVVASREATFRFIFSQIGLAGSDLGITYLLPRIIGLTRATKILLLGEVIRAEEAEQYGMVNILVSPGELMEATLKLAERIASNPPLAIEVTKLAINKGLGIDLSTDLEYETYLQNFCMQTEDHIIALKSFLEKTQPSFKRS